MNIEKINKAKAHTQYRLKDNTIVPGVTTILGVLDKPALVRWANRLGLQGMTVDKYVDGLANIGTLTHYRILCHLNKQEPDLSDYSPNEIAISDNSMASYFNWESQHIVRPILLETALVSERYRFGGTLDFYGWVDNVTTILDFKTGSGIYPEYFYQIAGYKLLLEEHGHRVDRGMILQIGRDKSEGFTTKEREDFTRESEIFSHCLSLYNLLKNKG